MKNIGCNVVQWATSWNLSRRLLSVGMFWNHCSLFLWNVSEHFGRKAALLIVQWWLAWLLACEWVLNDAFTFQWLLWSAVLNVDYIFREITVAPGNMAQATSTPSSLNRYYLCPQVKWQLNKACCSRWFTLMCSLICILNFPISLQ